MSADSTSPSPLQAQASPGATHVVYLALGSNLGDREAHLRAALQRLRAFVPIEHTSSLYETEPVGYLDQPRFLNMVMQGKTLLSPQDLLRQAKGVETAIGRQPTFRNGPRPIDIDILLYDDLQHSQEGLTIPHPRMNERAFVLAPLAEIAPTVQHPVSKQTIQQLLQAVSQAGITKLSRIELELP